MAWTVEDNLRVLARKAKQRFDDSGQNVAHNRKLQAQAQAKRTAAYEAQRRSLEQEVPPAPPLTGLLGRLVLVDGPRDVWDFSGLVPTS